jgi:hypothetical protein
MEIIISLIIDLRLFIKYRNQYLSNQQTVFNAPVSYGLYSPEAMAVLSPRAAITQKQNGGNCPCPYSRDSRGNICGERSEYSKSGGASPTCY